MKVDKHCFVAAILAGSALATPGFASAQEQAGAGEENGGIGDIVVTAQRREEGAQRVPISMTVLDAKALGAIDSSNEIGQAVPNIQIESTVGFGIPRIGIRGIAQGDFNANATTSNMLYIDDVPLNATIAQGVAIWDLERAEVLRGPQVTLFGRNATGGAIRYISAMPTKDLSGYGELTLGRFGKNEVRAALSGPITDRLGARVSYLGNWSRGDAYNVTLGRRVGKEDYNGIRGIIDWNPIDPVTIVLRGQYFKSDVETPQYKSTPGLTTFPGFGPLPDGRTVADIQREYGFQNLGYSSNFTITETDVPSSEHLEHMPLSANIDIDLGGVTLTSVTGYLRAKQDLLTDSDRTPAPILNTIERYKDRQWTQEVRLASNGDNRFDWILGGFYMHERVDSDIYFDVTEYAANAFFTGADTAVANRGSEQTTESWAVFAHGNYEITDNLSLIAAARYTKETKDVFYNFDTYYDFPTSTPRTSRQIFDLIRAVNSGNLGTVLAPARPATDSDTASWDNVSWKLSLEQKLSPGSMVYAMISRGFKGGAFKSSPATQREILNPDGSLLRVRPEIVTDYELGIKSDIIPRRLRINASVFYYDFKDYQTNQRNGTSQILSNLPGARLYGAEAEIYAVPLDGLYLTLGMGLTESEVTKSTDPALLGNKLPLAEDFNANASIRYTHDIGLGDLSFELSGKYRGHYYSTKENNSDELGGYVLLNGQIGFEARNGIIYGSLWGKNLTNQRQVTLIGEPMESFGSNSAYITPRRTYGITIGARF